MTEETGRIVALGNEVAPLERWSHLIDPSWRDVHHAPDAFHFAHHAEVGFDSERADEHEVERADRHRGKEHVDARLVHVHRS